MEIELVKQLKNEIEVEDELLLKIWKFAFNARCRCATYEFGQNWRRLLVNNLEFEWRFEEE